MHASDLSSRPRVFVVLLLLFVVLFPASSYLATRVLYSNPLTYGFGTESCICNRSSEIAARPSFSLSPFIGDWFLVLALYEAEQGGQCRVPRSATLQSGTEEGIVFEKVSPIEPNPV